MRGKITLDSELGKGTKASFCVPFNKPQFTGRQSPLFDIDAIPDRLRSEMSVSGCTSDLANGNTTPPMSPSGESLIVAHGHRKQRSGSAHLQYPASGDAGVEKSTQEIDRKKTHVLVVEDK